MKKATLAAIDVGTTKVCTAIAEVGENNTVNVIGVGITKSSGLHKGLVVNIGDAKDAIRESIKRAEISCGRKVESAWVGVTGRHVTSINNRGVVAITRNDRVVRPEDLKRVLQCAKGIEVPSGRKLLHVIPRTYAIDGHEGVHNPVGMQGFRLDVEAHVITAAVTSIQNLAKCIRGVGLDIDDLVLEPLASAEAVLTDAEKQQGAILADIGGGTTDIAVFKDGSIWHTAVIPVAGYQLTRDIAVGLGLPFDVAEDMKKKHGSVMRSETQSEMVSLPEDGHKASYNDLCDILRVRIEEVLKLIVLELPRSNYATLIPGGLVLTGGSSNLAGIDVLGRDVLKIPVRVGSPTNMSGIGETLRDPAYATCVGLLLWGMKYQDKPKAKPPATGISNGLLRKLFNRISSLFK